MAAPASCPLPIHEGPWTLEEVLAAPEDSRQRVELVDGSLIMSPAPTFPHQRILRQLLVAFIASAPEGMEVLPGVNILLSNERLLIPDLVVTTVPGFSGLCLPGSNLALAVEIASPSTRAYDRIFKLELYAEAEVPYYLVVDPDVKNSTAAAMLFELEEKRYQEVTRSRNGRLRMKHPFPAVVDLSV